MVGLFLLQNHLVISDTRYRIRALILVMVYFYSFFLLMHSNCVYSCCLPHRPSVTMYMGCIKNSLTGYAIPDLEATHPALFGQPHDRENSVEICGAVARSKGRYTQNIIYQVNCKCVCMQVSPQSSKTFIKVYK